MKQAGIRSPSFLIPAHFIRFSSSHPSIHHLNQSHVNYQVFCVICIQIQLLRFYSLLHSVLSYFFSKRLTPAQATPMPDIVIAVFVSNSPSIDRTVTAIPIAIQTARRISEIIFPLSAFSSVWALSVLICISSSVVIPKISASFGIVLTYGLVPGRITLNRPASPAEFFTPVLLSHE